MFWAELGQNLLPSACNLSVDLGVSTHSVAIEQAGLGKPAWIDWPPTEAANVRGIPPLDCRAGLTVPDANRAHVTDRARWTVTQDDDMAIEPKSPEMSLAEFLAWESEQSTKYEYERGGVLATIDSYGPGDRIIFQSIGVELPIEALYEDLDLGPIERAVLGDSEVAP